MKTSWPSRNRATAQRPGFRVILQSQFDSRRSRNPKYSLRAFARDLDVDHATLSQILRGRRPLTNRVITRLGTRLGLGQALLECYLAPARARPAGPAHDARMRAEWKSRQLSFDAFEVIADWHHFALLELTRVEGFRPDTRWIARALGISIDAVNVAISRLARLGLLEMRDRDTWEDRSGNVTINHGEITDVAMARIHREAHELAIRAIDRVPAALRDQTSITVALNSGRLPEIADLVARFKRDLEHIAGADDVKNDVYLIEVSVLPLTTLNNQKENPDA